MRPKSFLLALLASAAIPAVALADDAAVETSEVVVLGKRVIHDSAGATGLDLPIKETPQSVTVVGAAQIQAFALSDANQLLATLPGINVEAVETDRTYYNARGFDIINFQVDGVGQALDWGLQTGALDTVIYDRVEAVRGANGMMTGTGNPSATLNYIRKRPTETFQASASAAYGTWDSRRLTADISGPLSKDGSVAGRFVYANTDAGSHLDYYGVNRSVYYGVLSWDLTPKWNTTVGYSRQDNLATGVNWGALPLVWSDGTRIAYDVSATTGAPWTYWDTHSQTVFVETSYAFDSGWTLKGVYTHKAYDEAAQLLYAYGNPDKATGLGVGGMSGRYPSDLDQDMVDVVANGTVQAFGREHQLVAGFNLSKSRSHKYEAFAALLAYPAYQGTTVVAPAQPTYPPPYLAEKVDDRLNRAYAAAHLNLTDRLKAVVGVNAIDLKTTGFSYGVAQARDESKVSPYAGLTFEVTPQVTLYASYSNIFDPQGENDINARRLEAVEGRSYEAGAKGEWLDGRLLTTAAVFKSEQYGLAEYAGYIPGTTKAYYVGVDTFVEGYELEVAGRITPDWTISGGWTDLSIQDKDGKDVRLYLPRQTFKLSTTYGVPALRDLKLGAAIRWQSDISTTDLGVKVTQDSYAVLDLMGSIKLTDRVRGSLNIKNATDEEYLGSLKWSQAYYAPTRSVTVGLDWTF